MSSRSFSETLTLENLKKLLTPYQNCDILITNKGKDTLQTRKEFDDEESYYRDSGCLSER